MESFGRNTVFVDTWAWIAMAVRRDQFHARVSATHRSLRQSGRRYVTSDYVIGELITYLYNETWAGEAEAFIDGLFASFDCGDHRLVHLSDSQFRRTWELRRRFDDKRGISFIDFTSMIVMQDIGIADVFTGDRHLNKSVWGFGCCRDRPVISRPT